MPRSGSRRAGRGRNASSGPSAPHRQKLCRIVRRPVAVTRQRSARFLGRIERLSIRASQRAAARFDGAQFDRARARARRTARQNTAPVVHLLHRPTRAHRDLAQQRRAHACEAMRRGGSGPPPPMRSRHRLPEGRGRIAACPAHHRQTEVRAQARWAEATSSAASQATAATPHGETFAPRAQMPPSSARGAAEMPPPRRPRRRRSASRSWRATPRGRRACIGNRITGRNGTRLPP